MTTAKYQRKFRQQGRCTNCGKEIEPDENGFKRTLCPNCSEKAKKYNRSLRAKRIAEGMCSKCLCRPVLKGYKRCEECIEDDRERCRVRRIESYGYVLL